jgi:hypothetical protein
MGNAEAGDHAAVSAWCEDQPQGGETFPAPRVNLPVWACAASRNQKLYEKYDLDSRINPFFLLVDLKGESRAGIAVRIIERRSKKGGLAILRMGDSRATIIAAGNSFQDRGDDFSTADVFSAIPRGELLNCPFDNRKVRLRGEALIIGAYESGSFALYWNGVRYETCQLDD